MFGPIGKDQVTASRQLGYRDGYARRAPRAPADEKAASAYHGGYRRGRENRERDSKAA